MTARKAKVTAVCGTATSDEIFSIVYELVKRLKRRGTRLLSPAGEDQTQRVCDILERQFFQQNYRTLQSALLGLPAVGQILGREEDQAFIRRELFTSNQGLIARLRQRR